MQSATPAEQPGEKSIELPEELWRKILVLACIGNDNITNNTMLRNLRTRCQALKGACNACLTGVRISNTQIRSNSCYLEELVSLDTVTIIIMDASSIASDLNLLYSLKPNLTTLILGSISADMYYVQGDRVTALKAGDRQLTNQVACSFTCVSVGDIALALKPWRRSRLRNLCLDACTLRTRSGSVDLVPAWSPDIPALQTLTMNRCKLERLDLSLCNKIHSLSLSGNPQLDELFVSRAKALRRVTCVNNTSLWSLNLHGCTVLEVVECHSTGHGTGHHTHLELPYDMLANLQVNYTHSV